MANQMTAATWKIVAGLASLGAAMVTRRLVTSMWERSRGTTPPQNPADPDTSWGEALGWAAATGVAAAVARVFARRGATAGWRKATGHLPPGVGRGPEPA